MKKSEIFLLVGVIAAGIIAVLGQHFAEVAKTPFWWTFWDVATGISIIGLIGGWVFLKAREKSSIDKERS